MVIRGDAVGNRKPATGLARLGGREMRYEPAVNVVLRWGDAETFSGMAKSTLSRNHALRGPFFRCVERARSCGPTGWIGVRPLAVQRVWG
jgi:hypothetical protein